MKQNVLNLNRFYSMLKYNIRMYGKSYLTFYGAAFGIMIFVFLNNIIFMRFISPNSFSSTFTNLIFFTSMVVPSINFRELRNKTLATNYLTIPASIFEKFLSSFVITLFGGFLAAILVFVLSNILAIAFGVLFQVKVEFFDFWKWDILKQSLILYLVFHTLFFFGSTAFKKNPIVQTFLWSVISFIVIIIAFFYIITKIFQTNSLNFNFLYFDEIQATLDIIRIIGIIVFSLVIFLLWLASYFKIKEKQVI